MVSVSDAVTVSVNGTVTYQRIDYKHILLYIYQSAFIHTAYLYCTAVKCTVIFQ